MNFSNEYLDDLVPTSQRLDQLLERAAAAAQNVYGREAAAEPYRDLCITSDGVEKLVAREPGS